MVKVRATGAGGEPRVEHRPHPEPVAFDLTISPRLKIEIQIGLDTCNFCADTTIHLPTVARAVEPLQICVEARLGKLAAVNPPPSAALRATSTRSGVTSKLLTTPRRESGQNALWSLLMNRAKACGDVSSAQRDCALAIPRRLGKTSPRR